MPRKRAIEQKENASRGSGSKSDELFYPKKSLTQKQCSITTKYHSTIITMSTSSSTESEDLLSCRKISMKLPKGSEDRPSSKKISTVVTKHAKGCEDLSSGKKFSTMAAKVSEGLQRSKNFPTLFTKGSEDHPSSQKISTVIAKGSEVHSRSKNISTMISKGSEILSRHKLSKVVAKRTEDLSSTSRAATKGKSCLKGVPRTEDLVDSMPNNVMHSAETKTNVSKIRESSSDIATSPCHGECSSTDLYSFESDSEQTISLEMSPPQRSKPRLVVNFVNLIQM